MANNYTEATMSPHVFLTPKQKAMFKFYGATCSPKEGGFHYVYWESYFCEQPDEYDLHGELDEENLDDVEFPKIEIFLREVLSNQENSNIVAISVQGCDRCDKMRSGEFGGFALLVTRREYAWVTTDILQVDSSGKIVPNSIEAISFQRK